MPSLPPWVGALVGLLADTTSQLVKGWLQGKSESELLALGAESATAQAVLLGEQRRVLLEAEGMVEGFKVGKP